MLVGYAKVALALILDPSGGLFSDAARPCQRPAPRLVKILERPAGQQFVPFQRLVLRKKSIQR